MISKLIKTELVVNDEVVNLQNLDESLSQGDT